MSWEDSVSGFKGKIKELRVARHILIEYIFSIQNFDCPRCELLPLGDYTRYASKIECPVDCPLLHVTGMVHDGTDYHTTLRQLCPVKECEFLYPSEQ